VQRGHINRFTYLRCVVVTEQGGGGSFYVLVVGSDGGQIHFICSQLCGLVLSSSVCVSYLGGVLLN